MPLRGNSARNLSEGEGLQAEVVAVLDRARSSPDDGEAMNHSTTVSASPDEIRPGGEA